MKKQKQKFFSPKIKTRKIKINFFQKTKLNIGEDLLADYCGQCSQCKGCYLPPGCDLKSC